MSDENAENAWRDYTGGVAPAEQPKSWHAFLAGRASRDAEVERLQAEVKSLRQQLADRNTLIGWVIQQEREDAVLDYVARLTAPAGLSGCAAEYRNGADHE